MRHLLHKIVTKKTERLRACLLLALLITAGGLALGGKETPPTPAAPAEASEPGALSGLIVALDPGHGGYDGGARAQDSGRWEKDVALEIALEVEKALLARGAQVVLTRREDVCLADGDTASKTRKREDLQKRIDIAEAADADVLLSIHLNEYRSREESGPQVFYRHGSDQGRLLAGTLQQALLDGLKPSRERSALAGDYYVLGGTMPSVLVECGFLSNPREEALLLDPAYQQQIGPACANRTGGCRLTAGNRLFPPPTHAMMKRYDRPTKAGADMPDSLLPKPFSLQEAKLKNPLALAYLGDTVWDLLIRQRLLAGGLPAGALHRRAILLANAGAQAEAAARIEPVLSPEEADVMRRGQNAHAHHRAPKNQDPVNYSRATGLEALMGYLYLTGQIGRIAELFDIGVPIL